MRISPRSSVLPGFTWTDATAGFALVASDGVARFIIPNGTVIPARGHYLFVGSAYSLANYGGTGSAAGDQMLSQDIERTFDRRTRLDRAAVQRVAGGSDVYELQSVGRYTGEPAQ